MKLTTIPLLFIFSYMMCSSAEELRKIANWDGKGQISRLKLMEKLQSELSEKRFYLPKK